MLSTAHAPHRLFRVGFTNNPWELPSWERLLAATKRGRWDDPHDEFRVLYAADREVGAYVEVLQGLRARHSALAILDDVNDDDQLDPGLSELDAAIDDKLRHRIFHVYRAPVGDDIRPGEDRLVDVEGMLSRTALGSFLGADVKLGDVHGTDIDVTRQIARFVYEARDTDGWYVGVMSPSAEHPGTHCYNVFTRERDDVDLRIVQLYPAYSRHTSDPDQIAFIAEAKRYLST